MSRYIVGRVFQALVIIWLVSVFIFVIGRMIGNPVDIMVPLEAGPEVREQIIQTLGLNQPVYVQYGRFLKGILRGDFGESYRWGGRPAMQILLERIPATLELSAAAMVFALAIGVIGGILAAVRPGTWLEKVSMGGAVFGQTVPGFWIGIMMIMVFSVKLGWLPTGGRGGVAHLIMPAITLGLWSTAVLARLTRSKMIEVLSQEYIKMVRLKGLNEKRVIIKHALRNAAVPLITISGLELGTMIGGAVITESVFTWPGIGRLAVDSVLARDYAVVQAVVLLVSFAFVGINLMTDLCYGFLDPRIRLGQKAA